MAFSAAVPSQQQALNKNSSLKSNDIPNEIEKEQIIYHFNESILIQLEQVQAIIDGAILAAEQVQDKRLEMLENGPEVTVTDLLFDGFLTLCLQSSIAGNILKIVTQKIFTPLLKSASKLTSNILTNLPSDKLKSKNTDDIIKYFREKRGTYAVAKALEWKQEEIDIQITAERLINYNSYIRFVHNYTDKVAERDWIALAKAMNDIRKSKKTPEMVKRGDSAAVAVLSEAMEYLGHHRFVLSRNKMIFDKLIRSDLFRIEDSVNLMVQLYPEDINMSNYELRNKYKLFYESIIWVALLGYDRYEVWVKDNYLIYYEPLSPAAIANFAHPKTKSITPTLTSYFLDRFQENIQEFITSDEFKKSKYYKNILKIARMQNFLPTQEDILEQLKENEYIKLSYLAAYFNKIGQELREVKPRTSFITAIK